MSSLLCSSLLPLAFWRALSPHRGHCYGGVRLPPWAAASVTRGARSCPVHSLSSPFHGSRGHPDATVVVVGPQPLSHRAQPQSVSLFWRADRNHFLVLLQAKQTKAKQNKASCKETPQGAAHWFLRNGPTQLPDQGLRLHGVRSYPASCKDRGEEAFHVGGERKKMRKSTFKHLWYAKVHMFYSIFPSKKMKK